MSELGELTSNELTILESLQDSTEAISQRDLARRTGFSVGLVNAVLKKLVRTGYVKTSHLNRRSLEYLLTPSGFAQTALRSYRYIVNTMRGYRDIQRKLHGVLSNLKEEGYEVFYLHGDGELAELVAIFFDDEGFGPLRRGLPKKGEAPEERCVVLNTEPVKSRRNGWKTVDLVYEFANGAGGAQKKRRGSRKLKPDHEVVKTLRDYYKSKEVKSLGAKDTED
jgi:DNA-binding MarR family transcriptional regulator